MGLSRYRSMAAPVLVALVLVATGACSGDEGDTATDGSVGTSPTTGRRSGTTVIAAPTDDAAPSTTTTLPAPPTNAPTTTRPAPSPPPPPTAAPGPTTTTAVVPPDQVMLTGTVCTRPAPGTACAPGGAFLVWPTGMGTVTGDDQGRFQRLLPVVNPQEGLEVAYWATTPTQTCSVDPPDGRARAGTVLEVSVECTVGPLATIKGTACTRPPVSAPPGAPCQPGGFFGVERMVGEVHTERWLIGSTSLGGYPIAGEQQEDGTWMVQVAPGRYTISTMTLARPCSGQPAPLDVVAGATVTIDVTCSSG